MNADPDRVFLFRLHLSSVGLQSRTRGSSSKRTVAQEGGRTGADAPVFCYTQTAFQPVPDAPASILMFPLGSGTDNLLLRFFNPPTPPDNILLVLH